MCYTPYLTLVKGYMQLLPDGSCLQCDKQKTNEIVSRMQVELENPKYLLTDDIRSTLRPCFMGSDINHIKLYSKYIACFMTLTLEADNTTDKHHGTLTHHGKSYEVKNRKKKHYNFHSEVNSVLWSNQSTFFTDGFRQDLIEKYEKQYQTNFQYWSYVLQRPQLKNFEDDVRKYVLKHPQENGKTYLCPNPREIKFVACGEYGTRRSRPHYHIIFLGFMPLDIKRSKHHNDDSPSENNFNSRIIDKIWDNKGEVDIAYDINLRTMRYCCKYLAKSNAVEHIIPHVTAVSNSFKDFDFSQLLDERYLIEEYTPFIHYSNNIGMETLKIDFNNVLQDFDLTPADIKQPNYIKESDYFLLGVNNKRKTYFIYKEKFLKLPHDLRRHFVNKITYHSFSGFYDKISSLSHDECLDVIKNSYSVEQNSDPSQSCTLSPFELSFSYDCLRSTWSSKDINYNICYQDYYGIDFKKVYHDQTFLKTLCNPNNGYIRLQVEKCMFLGNDDYTKNLLEEYKDLNLGTEEKKHITKDVMDNILKYMHLCPSSDDKELPNTCEYLNLIRAGLSNVRSFVEESYNKLVKGGRDKNKNSSNLVSNRVEHVTYCDGTEETIYPTELKFNSRQLQRYDHMLHSYRTPTFKMLLPNFDTGLLGGIQRSTTKTSFITAEDGNKVSVSRLYNKSLPFYKIEDMCLYDWLKMQGSDILDEDGRLNTDKPMSQYIVSKRKRFYKVLPNAYYLKMHWDNIEKTLTDYLVNLEKPSEDGSFSKVKPAPPSFDFLNFCAKCGSVAPNENIIKIRLLLSKALLLRLSKELTKMEDGILFYQDVRDIISDYDISRVIDKLRIYVADNIKKFGERSKLMLLLNYIISRLTIVNKLKLVNFRGNRVRENPLLHSSLTTFDDVFKFLMFYNPSSYRIYFRACLMKSFDKERLNTPRKRFEHFFGVTMEQIEDVYNKDCLDLFASVERHETVGDRIKKIINKSKFVEVEFKELNEQITIFDEVI